jgi:nitric oxide reductase large subunit
MNPGISAFLVLLALSLIVAAILFFALRVSLRELLRNTVKLPAGVTFYVRSFLLVLFFAALSAAIGTSFDLKPDARSMEYVWAGAQGLSSVLEKTLWLVVIYAIVVTILVAVLKIQDDK